MMANQDEKIENIDTLELTEEKPIKKKMGRPVSVTPEEKARRKAIYMQKYQMERYHTDDVYRKKKIELASEYTRGKRYLY
jgi:hypothetical protein